MDLVMAGGRPPELTQDVVNRILSIVTPGMYAAQLARLARISLRTLDNWLLRGKKELDEGIQSIYVQFLLDFEEKKGKKIDELLERMERVDNFQSNAWLLERLDNENLSDNRADVKKLVDIVKEMTGESSHG